MNPRFQPGRVFSSPTLLSQLSDRQRRDCLTQHITGQWSEPHRARNERAVRDGGDVLSAFTATDQNGRPINVWVFTLTDRKMTLVMTPEESPFSVSDLWEELEGVPVYTSPEPPKTPWR